MNNFSVVRQPILSVVVASQNSVKSIGDCLRAIEKQGGNRTIEIIVVDNSTDETAQIVKREFPAVIFISADGGKLIPELWGIGIDLSAGDYVALTTAHFIPADSWVREIIKAHEREPHAGIGGAIENDAQANAISWAIYFCRYSPYMLPFGETAVEDFAADNASYKRRDLKRVKDAMRGGFWETFVHRQMRQAGMSLFQSPEIVVIHRQSFTFSGFMNQRFWHGRQFGTTRAADISSARRLAFVLLSPAIPALYLYRITRRVFARKRNIAKFLRSFPILILFLLSWSAGEFSGYLWSFKSDGIGAKIPI